ncbi:MAG: SUF system Fe-S cluster assembly regulator [Gammaproteobacteria bacterium]|nr:SUF system Fe-S cluster assembly regulator [Gammaproteobacteria bacterium]
MLRMSRMTDYGTVVLATLAGRPDTVHSASELVDATGLNEPTVRKILKTLTKANLVVSFRGPQGGYALNGEATSISAARILDALEGPVALTECSAAEGNCQIQSCCTVGRSWQLINHRIRVALEDVSLAQLVAGGPVEGNPIELDFSIPQTLRDAH